MDARESQRSYLISHLILVTERGFHKLPVTKKKIVFPSKVHVYLSDHPVSKSRSAT